MKRTFASLLIGTAIGSAAVCVFSWEPNSRATHLSASTAALAAKNDRTLTDDLKTLRTEIEMLSDKPYLRPHIPERPASSIINFDPQAAWPK